MKLFKWLTAVVLLGTAQMAQSAPTKCGPCYTNPSCNICDISFCEVEFSAYVDVLYWHSRHGGLTDQFYMVDSLCPDYDWGYRLGAAASWNGWDLGLRYTSFKNKSNTKVKDPDPLVQDNPPYTKISYKLDLQVLDLEAGRTCCLRGGITLRPFAGAKFAWTDSKVKRELFPAPAATSPLTTHKYALDFEGQGIYVGMDWRWPLFTMSACERDIPVAFVSRISTGILDGDFKHAYTLNEGETNEDSDSFTQCRVIPVHELYIGLDFRVCDILCMDTFFQVGYEAQYWGWNELSTTGDTSHLGMGGMVLRFGTHF
jgi:hypothetical protein